MKLLLTFLLGAALAWPQIIVLPKKKAAPAGPTITQIGSLRAQAKDPSVTLTAGCSSGNKVLVYGGIPSAGTPSNLVDSRSNTYSALTVQSDANKTAWSGYATVTTSLQTNDTVSFTLGYNANNVVIYCVSGIGDRDQEVAGNSGYAATSTSPSLTPTNSSTLAIAVHSGAATFSGDGTIIGSAATTVFDAASDATYRALRVQYRILSATTAGTSVATYASSASGNVIFQNWVIN